MTVIPAEALTAIEAVIINDEGGWVLTSNANDPDGGWTYAGVTAKTYAEYTGLPIMPYNTAIHWFTTLTEEAERKRDIYEIYYERYYRPLQELNTDNPPPSWMLSCGINCGLQTAADLFEWCPREEEEKQKFLHKWLLHYAQLVRNNAEAWRDYANKIERLIVHGEDLAQINDIEVEKPKLLRAETLAGWINRVERYR